jgi:hypothetical protein
VNPTIGHLPGYCESSGRALPIEQHATATTSYCVYAEHCFGLLCTTVSRTRHTGTRSRRSFMGLACGLCVAKSVLVIPVIPAIQ